VDYISVMCACEVPDPWPDDRETRAGRPHYKCVIFGCNWISTIEVLVRLAPMRLLCLLFLLVVLPVQMSWAAVHACNDDIGVRGAIPAALEVEAERSAAPALEEAATNESNESGSPVHACDGLHELMADEVRRLLEPESASFLLVPDTVIRLDAIAARLDRPQWGAA